MENTVTFKPLKSRKENATIPSEHGLSGAEYESRDSLKKDQRGQLGQEQMPRENHSEQEEMTGHKTAAEIQHPTKQGHLR